MYNHKLNFHINAINKQVADAITRMNPRILKTLHHDVNFWKGVRQLHPETFIIGRLYDPNQHFLDDPARRGREFAERVLREDVNRFEVNGRPIYDAWESFNEIMPESASDENQKKYDDFQVAFAQKMRAEGFESIGMNFATGNLLGHHFLDNFTGTLETHKYLGFHEYDWPTMDRLHKIGLEDGNGGMWLCLRYRRVMNDVRQKYGHKHTVIITECGMTQGVVGGQDVGPWDSGRPISANDYWQSLQWYNSELMKDNYVMGACLFVVGAISPWHSFEHLGAIMDRLAAFQVDLPDTPIETETEEPVIETPEVPIDEPAVEEPVVEEPVVEEPKPPVIETPIETEPEEPPFTTSTTPEETPQPIPPPSDPNTVSLLFPKSVANYHSHYVLFPAGTGEWWYTAARPYLRHFGCSHGEQLTDAVFLRGLQGHTITCVNASPDMLAFIRQQNPGAKLDLIDVDSPEMLAATLGKRIATNRAF